MFDLLEGCIAFPDFDDALPGFSGRVPLLDLPNLLGIGLGDGLFVGLFVGFFVGRRVGRLTGFSAIGFVGFIVEGLCDGAAVETVYSPLIRKVAANASLAFSMLLLRLDMTTSSFRGVFELISKVIDWAEPFRKRSCLDDGVWQGEHWSDCAMMVTSHFFGLQGTYFIIMFSNSPDVSAKFPHFA